MSFCSTNRPQAPLGPYWQHIVLFVTYKLTQYSRALHNIRLQRLSSVKCSNLLVLFLSYDEKEVLLIWSQDPHSEPFIFYTYKWPNKLEHYTTLGWKGLIGTSTLPYSAHS
jgi:hypothetical protein